MPPLSGGDRRHLGRIAYRKCEEAQKEHGVSHRGAEVPPERNICTGIIRGKYQHKHINRTEYAGGPYQDSSDETQADGHLTVRHQESYENAVRQDKALQLSLFDMGHPVLPI